MSENVAGKTRRTSSVDLLHLLRPRPKLIRGREGEERSLNPGQTYRGPFKRLRPAVTIIIVRSYRGTTPMS